MALAFSTSSGLQFSHGGARQLTRPGTGAGLSYLRALAAGQPDGSDPLAGGERASDLRKALPVLGGATNASRRQQRPQHTYNTVQETKRRLTTLAGGIQEDQSSLALPPYLLRSVANRNVVAQAIIHTIINQVASHFVRPLNEQSIGVKIRQKDQDRPLTAAAAKEARRLLEIVLQGGVMMPNLIDGEPGIWDASGEEHADTLAMAVRKIMRDSLTLDRAFVVTEGSLSGKEPVLFWKHVDGGLIRMVDKRIYEPQIRNGAAGRDDLTGRTKYVQLRPDFDFAVDREFAWNEGYLACRNPSPELLSFGYGVPELSQCMMAAEGVLYGMKSNQDWFTENHVPNGIISIVGNFAPDDIEDLKSQFQYEIGMLGGSIWKTPILQSNQAQPGAAVNYTPFVDRSRMDMVSKTWIELCVALMSAVYQIAPEEFGFHGFGGPSSTIGGDGGTEEKLQHSQHKGLLPKVLWLAEFFSKAVVERINPDFELVIQGLDAVYNPEQLLKAQLEQALLSNGMTLEGLAARNDQPCPVDPLDEELWDEVRETFAGQFFPTERARVEAMVQAYKGQGGKLGDYPRVPGHAIMSQVWMQQHGIMDQQQAQSDMGQMAASATDADQQQKQAERQGAQADLQALGSGEQDFQNEQRGADAEAARGQELRIPMAPSAGGLAKAVRVYRIGARDE